MVLSYALLWYFSKGIIFSCIGTFEATACSTDGIQTWRMAEAVMVKLEELGVGAWLAQGDRVIRFHFPLLLLPFVSLLVNWQHCVFQLCPLVSVCAVI